MARAKKKAGKARRSRWARWRVPLAIVGLPIGAFLGLVFYLFWSTHGSVYTEVGELPNEPVAIVFGAGLRQGKPSLVLRGRLDASIELYRKGKVSKLLMSGDNRTRYYNEPEAMRRYALDHAIPSRDIMVDSGGRDTFDTCYRARHVFGIKQAVLVTQCYHAPRALYLARGFGIDAVAFATPNLDQFPALQLSYTGREYLADAKAFWEMNFSRRASKIQ